MLRAKKQDVGIARFIVSSAGPPPTTTLLTRHPSIEERLDILFDGDAADIEEDRPGQFGHRGVRHTIGIELLEVDARAASDGCARAPARAARRQELAWP